MNLTNCLHYSSVTPLTLLSQFCPCLSRLLGGGGGGGGFHYPFVMQIFSYILLKMHIIRPKLSEFSASFTANFMLEFSLRLPLMHSRLKNFPTPHPSIYILSLYSCLGHSFCAGDTLAHHLLSYLCRLLQIIFEKPAMMIIIKIF